MSILRKMYLVSAGMLLVGLIGFPVSSMGQGTSGGKGKKPEVINMALITDLSGPYAPIHGPMYFGILDAVEYVNQEKGGIKGVTVKGIPKDSGNKVDQAVAHYNELREMKPRPLFLSMGVSGESEALRARFAEDQIPVMTVSALSAIYPKAYSFGTIPLYTDYFGAFIDWVVETWDKPRPPKLAFLTWDTTFGRAILTKECYEYAKKKGVEVVAEELYGIRDVDVTTQLIRIRDRGADWIYNNTTTSGVVIIGKGIKELGLNIRLAAGPGFDQGTLRINPQALEGAIAVFSYANMFDTRNASVAKMMEYFNKNGRKEKHKSAGYTAMWCYVLAAAEAISRAVDEVGWERLNGAAVKDQMVKMKDFAPLGGLTYYTFTENRRTPNKILLYRAEKGMLVPFGSWRETPDLRPETYK